MINLKLPDHLLHEWEDVLHAIRQHSRKQRTSLDFQFIRSTLVGDDALFLGRETTNKLTVTRVRVAAEQLFPKLIVRFDKREPNRVTIRFSLLSSLVAIWLVVVGIVNLVYSIRSSRMESDTASILVFAGLFIAATFAEYKLTQRKLKEALSQEQNSHE